MQLQKFFVRFLFAFLVSLTITNIASIVLSNYKARYNVVDVSSHESSESVEPSFDEIFVIESNKLQLVVSSIGGCISEINIPFESSTSDTKVFPLAIDKQLYSKSSRFSKFPINNNNVCSDKECRTFFYPLLRRGGSDFKLKCMNIVSDYEQLDKLKYQLVSKTPSKVTLKTSDNLRTITKTFELRSDVSNIVTCTIDVEGDCRGLWLTSGVLEVELVSGKPTQSVVYRSIKKSSSQVKSIPLNNGQSYESLLDLQWIGSSNGFFAFIMEPINFAASSYKVDKIDGSRLPSRYIDSNKPELGTSEGYEFFIPIPSKGGIYECSVFAGPLLDSLLTSVDNVMHPSSDSPKFKGCWESKGWLSFMSAPFSKLLSYLLPKFFYATGSWTLSIILLTLVLRILLYPFNAWSLSSIEKIRALSPVIAEIQERYKDDDNRAKMEIFNLYRQHNINPFSGLIPLFAQMPFLFGMFDVLRSRFELRGACAVTGWIDNLAAPDVLFSWNFSLPIIGNELHLLPILLGLIMFLQQVSTAQGLGQNKSGHFNIFMTVFFVVMFYNFPAGLNIYWMSSILFALLQQTITRKFTS